MIRAMYTAASGMSVEAHRMDLAAKNLYYAEIPGYKATMEVRAAVRPTDAMVPTDVQTRYVGEYHDPSAGQLNPSANPLDLAIEGDGFFAVQTKGGLAYTRDGRFRPGSDRVLRGPGGGTLLGRNGPVTMPADVGMDAQIDVDYDGTLRVNGNEVDRIRLADFPGYRGLQAAGSSLFYPMAGVTPKAARGRILQNTIETGNVQAVAEMTRTIESLRAFESYQRVITTVMEDVTGAAVRQIGRVG